MLSRRAKSALKIQLKSIHARVTRNRLTTVFFLFGFVHCIAQGLIQSFLFSIDSQYSSFLNSIMSAAKVDPRNHTNLLGSSGDFRLEMCNDIPHNSTNCQDIFFSRNVSLSTDPNGTIRVVDLKNTSLMVNSSTTTSPQVILQVDQHDAQNPSQAGTVNITLNTQCIGTLLYADQHLQNSKREDIVFLALQFWLFGMSVIAMCYDSVPHVFTILGTRILLTAWSIYALWRTDYQESIFKQMIEDPGTPCAVQIFPEYSTTRINYEIPDLVLNCTALGIAAYLSWSLFRVYNSESVHRIGAPEQITKIYKYFLAVQVCLQLEAFTLMAWMGLWIDQLFNSYIHPITTQFKLYEALFIFYTVLLGPWMLLGWFGIRHEKRVTTAIFILMSIVFTTFAGVMFDAPVYQWTYYVWPCWGCYATAALVLLVATCILSVVCWRNFDKGLAQYLHAEAALASSDFAAEVFQHDVEKASTMSNEKTKRLSYDQPLPTYYLPNLSSSASSVTYRDSIVNSSVESGRISR